MNKNYARYTKLILLVLFSNLFCMHSSAQWYDPEKVNKKAAAIYSIAYEEATDGKYQASCCPPE